MEELMDEQALEPNHLRGGRQIMYILGTHFLKLVTANLIFVLFALPLVTLPASAVALMAVTQTLYRESHCISVWETFWKEFKFCFWPKTLISLLLLSLPVLGWFLGGLVSETFTFVGAAIFTVGPVLVLSYWYPQLATLSIGWKQSFGNAVVLAATEAKNSFLILLILVVTAVITYLPWFVSGPLVMLVVPVLAQLFIGTVVTGIMEEKIIKNEA